MPPSVASSAAHSTSFLKVCVYEDTNFGGQYVEQSVEAKNVPGGLPHAQNFAWGESYLPDKGTACAIPTEAPTATPTSTPTVIPTRVLAVAVTATPTVQPTRMPPAISITAVPTEVPTEEVVPTETPTPEEDVSTPMVPVQIPRAK